MDDVIEVSITVPTGAISIIVSPWPWRYKRQEQVEVL